MRNQNETKKRIPVVYAAAAAVASTGLFAPVGAGTPSAPNTNANACSKPTTTTHNIHETLWGNPEVWEGEAYAMDSSSTLGIPRGGTDESQSTPPSSKHKKDKTKSDKKKKTRKSKKDKPKPDKEEEKATEEKSDEAEKENAPFTNPMMEEILQHHDFYDILGLPRGEDDTSKIKKAYRRRAVQTHPDKTGGDRRAFDKLAEAYEVLLDDDKRALYDRYGKAGLDPTRGPPGGMNAAEDMFRSFFGQAPPQRGPINRTARYQLQVTLEEMYQGKTKKVTVEAPRGSNFYAQFEQSKKKQVEINIPRGAQPGQSVVLSGEMDFDSLDSPPGDLIFTLHPRAHRTFTRKGFDLAKEETISLQEAICGFTRRFHHLNGKYITVESAKHPIPPVTLSDLDPPTEDEESENASEDSLTSPHPTTAANIYIQTGDVQVLKGKGMPKNPHGTEFGDLYIQYTVELPKAGATENLTPSERLELARLMEKLEGKSKTAASSSKKGSGSKAKQEALQLQPARASDFGRASGPVPTMEEEHDPHGPEGHQQQQFPFAGMGHRQFFFSSTGSSPFFGQQNNFEDDGTTQCRQM